MLDELFLTLLVAGLVYVGVDRSLLRTKRIERSLRNVPGYSNSEIVLGQSSGAAFSLETLTIAVTTALDLPFASPSEPRILHIDEVRDAVLMFRTIPRGEALPPKVRYWIELSIADIRRPEVILDVQSREEGRRFIELMNQMRERGMAENNSMKARDTNMRILYLAANPITANQIDLEREARDVQEQLVGTAYRDLISFKSVHAVRPSDLIRHITEFRPNIIHFSGHGSQAGIILRSDDPQGQHQVEIDALRRALRSRDIKLVVLNACYSSTQAQGLQGAVDAIVGTTDAVEDEAAHRFAVEFYRALGNGLTIELAFRDATDIVALYNLHDVFHSEGDLNLTFVP